MNYKTLQSSLISTHEFLTFLETLWQRAKNFAKSKSNQYQRLTNIITVAHIILIISEKLRHHVIIFFKGCAFFIILNSWWIHHYSHSSSHSVRRKIFGKLSSHGSGVSMGSCYFAPNHSQVGLFGLVGNWSLVLGLKNDKKVSTLTPI